MTIGIDTECFCSNVNLGSSSSITRNIPLEGYAYSDFYFCCVNCNDTQDLDVSWEIQRADGEIETYTGPELNGVDTSESQNYLDRGVRIYGFCNFQYKTCDFYLRIHPTDMRYNGAQIIGTLHLPVCYTGSNITESLTLNIQGTKLCVKCIPIIIQIIYM